MKITRQTDQHLIVSETPWFTALAILLFTLIFIALGVSVLLSGNWFGLMFLMGAAIGLVAMWAFARRVQVVFDAHAQTVTFRQRSLTGYRQVVHELSDIKDAVLETTRSDNSTLYRISIVLQGESEGRHPIAEAYSNIGDHTGICETINTWLDARKLR